MRHYIEAGVIFCSMSEAIKEYPDLVREHLGSVVPVGDNYFTALNAAVFSDGSFCYIPKGGVGGATLTPSLKKHHPVFQNFNLNGDKLALSFNLLFNLETCLCVCC